MLSKRRKCCRNVLVVALAIVNVRFIKIYRLLKVTIMSFQ